jgi:PLP dependent protein
MQKIDDKLQKVTERINRSAIESGRKPETVRLIAVSKTQPATAIRQAYHAGQRLFGENYLQEALDKQQQLSDLQDIEWHFIGPVQSNKTRPIAENFSWVHSIDRLKIAQRLSEQRPASLPPLNICIQINIDDENTKSGVNLQELPELVAAVQSLSRLQLRGLMAIPAAGNNPDQQQAAFRKIAEVKKHYDFMDTLSMGMSGDLEIAIAEGATLVRVGTDIFGSREKITQTKT